ncbi:transcriptional repressor [Mesorhizobium sp. RP14(2022)]|uniref:Transcriptional repressor n=1 Tax=Mesorhizobium liriopis TaxID=2953882 RepID=A0ABT1CAH1_9HYPH|nr:Fur family transcriptional regulator [Mesorhizobium liriopis]MCO6050976.1 transcriptional repressor [Mesorhizobium liriopis]
MTEAKALTKNQTLVLGALSGANGPLSAYDILDRLRPEGLRSPLQIYRALAPLVEQGRVHRLESLNSFVACAHDHTHGHHSHSPVVFAICETCGQVTEFSDEKVAQQLRGWAKDVGFKTGKTTLELRGTCRTCLAA